MSSITDKEWDRLAPEDYDTLQLLQSVDEVDRLGGTLRQQLRDDLLELHQVAMAVFLQGARSRVGELFELAGDLQDQVVDIKGSLSGLKRALSDLMDLYPESLSYDDEAEGSEENLTKKT